MAIFDVMGPIMIRPSSLHTAGAAKIGYLAQRVYGKPVRRVRISLCNSFAETGQGGLM
jgi:L-serine dehydratase